MKRKLGRSDIEVSALGFGCWAIGGPFTYLDIQAGWGETDDAESVRAIHRALDLGVNFFDTAANYGAGHSERVLARALAGRRGAAVIATKFGHKVDVARKHVAAHDDPRHVLAELRAVCERSLRDLGTEYIDLYQLHVGDYPVDMAVAVREQLEALVSEGKIRYYGWSTDSVERARVFADGKHCVAVQHDMNIVLRADAMIALCEREGLASLNRTPLARGALTGKYTRDTQFVFNDVRNDPWAREHVLLPAFQHLDALREVLTSNGRTLTQGALAWLWARSPNTIPIPGMRTVAQVEENAGALRFGPLADAQMRQVDALLSFSA
jgi:aryl-alcohol dehydrogenase-like predicted oxidoreductase